MYSMNNKESSDSDEDIPLAFIARRTPESKPSSQPDIDKKPKLQYSFKDLDNQVNPNKPNSKPSSILDVKPSYKNPLNINVMKDKVEKEIPPLESSDDDDDVPLAQKFIQIKKETPVNKFKLPFKTIENNLNKPQKSEESSDDDSSDDDIPLTKRAEKILGKKIQIKKLQPIKKPISQPTPIKRKREKSFIVNDDSSSSSESDSSDYSSGSSSSSSSGSSSSGSESDGPRRKRKRRVSHGTKSRIVEEDLITTFQERDVFPLVAEDDNFRWWPKFQTSIEETKVDEIKWKTLRHNGVVFSPPYEPHGVKMLYDGKPVELTAEQEEPATWFAAILESQHAENPTFCENFLDDWKKLLGSNHIIQSLEKCDFRPIYNHLQEQKQNLVELRKTKEYKAKQKTEKKAFDDIYGFALVDNVLEKVGNPRVEPPGLFRGRGKHPKTGRIKARITPEMVILNFGKDEPAPKCPVPGHKWKGLVYKPQCTWLAMWRDEINNDLKYAMLASSSRFKGFSDYEKYQKARRLKTCIAQIRQKYMHEINSSDIHIRQRATALWMIDILALRVGNEKNTQEEADTVGTCSLRVEHITFKDGNIILLDFLGKDSMRYLNEIHIKEDSIYRNLKNFCRDKQPEGQIFDRITPNELNSHLTTQMKGLTAKVFRTFNASITLQEELEKRIQNFPKAISNDEKILQYHLANREVAILCNHQRTVPKSYEGTKQKLDNRLKELLDKCDFLQDCINDFKGKSTKKQKKNYPEEFKKPASYDKAKNQLSKLKIRIKKLETQQNIKGEDFKTIALGTSKKNYMDPRITTAFCKNVQIPIETVFSKSLLNQFPWAMEVLSQWKF